MVSNMGGARWRTSVAPLLFLLLMWVFPGMARTVPELDAARQPVPLLDWGDAWIDPTGQLGPEQVATDPAIAWTPTRQDAVHLLSTGKALWIRFTLPAAPDAERWYLEIPHPSVDRVTLYTPDGLDRWAGQTAGDRLPVAAWPVPHRHPLLPLEVSAEQPRAYLLRVENAHNFGAPLSFVSESYVSQHEQRTSLVLGIYFGLAGLAAAMAVLSALTLRDEAYALYGLNVALTGLSQACLTGIAGLHLWPRAAAWNNLAVLVVPVLAMGALLWFFSATVSLAQRSRRMHRLLLVLQLLSLPAALGVAFIEPSSRFALMAAYVALAAASGMLALVWAARRGDRWAWWMLAASIPVGLGAAFPLARASGLMAVNFWTTHGLQIGLAAELPLVLMILMLRTQHRRENYRRIHGLDRIDPGTGLINATVFTERLVRLVARSQRQRLRGAVLLIDIVNVESIRRAYDQRAAQELPLRVAGRLLAVAREIDSVARLSEQRFGMLLEGPLTAEDVAAAAPRVVAQCLMPYRNKPLDWVAQVRVAQALVPMDGTDVPDLLARMDALLASVPPDAKRAVFALGKPTS
ncbi:7TM diverse intracellular signaling domain-containing protein [Ramlibacter sp.]|uniref:sensor domain-containing diguanylate cyclase n=1 Tax=Ramlibacter sp. TaxID=1917967 RepID=UPI0017AA47E0|nr:7TM diverse intracellular signaling domain-containing protein [Ramlibacter sp.]MBA2672283.1 diguanylate cyclase [Ramlibacter sp.]